MADEFHLGSGNWWDSNNTSRNRFDGGATPPVSISTTLNSIASFGWPTEMVEMKPSGGSQLLQGGAHDQSSAAAAACGGGLANPNLQMMGLGLSSHQGIDWNQTLFRGEKAESSFRSMLEEDMSSNTAGGFEQSGATTQEQWRSQKVYSDGSPAAAEEESSLNDYKQINIHRGFSLDVHQHHHHHQQLQFSHQASSNDSTITTSHNLNNSGSTFPVDSAAAYGLLLSENQPMNYQYPSGGYGGGASDIIPSWNKFPQFLRQSPPPKQQPPPPASSGSHLHFTNNAPFWNASSPASAMSEAARSSFFPAALQTQIPPSFDEKPKTSEARESSTTTKKNNTETSNKRPRNETPNPLPAFKVRKEKMGDRITALQQLVSPFGKTDTASVLSDAIEYIKFLHEQISALSDPYMKNPASTHHHQKSEKSKDQEGPRQDLRNRGLCLVPVSSTFPVAHETTVDFWTPTFGGSFR
ncbi:hypothetical protein ABFS82_13G176000 [Erythranthe guttata]|uniref:transcription factor bHLH123-like isoform X2 n=1 Tax=Erythranthe guttata TaxID=4155 RepID=UPI00064DEDE4|nr:PREDICTED: transcription factor bHLH123-like isoform X2 [Erythranthe guttata]|eukprot:XP_012827623.1 PREDICTED: transcription factor bHLH123-like isoform X2 [Erythranthe guttata]